MLSVAYSFSNPNKPRVANEYAHVVAENNWTSAQVAKYPDRLIGFCSVNPLSSYAIREITRCAKDKNLRTGLKLHFGNSDVDVDNPEHLARVRSVFRAANQQRMAITVHMHANIDHHRPYGAKEARIFLEQLLAEAPDVTVQIAHLAGGGGYHDPTTDEALSVFIDAIGRKDPRMKNVYFDVCGIAISNEWEDKADLIVQRIRQIGTKRVLYGSDAAIPGNLPKETLQRWHQLPLTQEEFHVIETNVYALSKKLDQVGGVALTTAPSQESGLVEGERIARMHWRESRCKGRESRCGPRPEQSCPAHGLSRQPCPCSRKGLCPHRRFLGCSISATTMARSGNGLLSSWETQSTRSNAKRTITGILLRFPLRREDFTCVVALPRRVSNSSQRHVITAQTLLRRDEIGRQTSRGGGVGCNQLIHVMRNIVVVEIIVELLAVRHLVIAGSRG